ncbi:MAG: Co-chaperone protein DjlA [Pseudomonas citronellolis]|nr:MAG: Co-chaperone protein DjlA [Pseudomonas citronellolis]
MFWPGTLIGILAGWALASIPGALLGAVLGQLLDRRMRRRSWRELFRQLRGAAPIEERELLFLMLGRVAKSRGRVSDEHIRQARAEMQRLQLDDAHKREAIQAFGRGKQGGSELEEAVHQWRGQRASAEGLVQACWRMACAAGAPSPAERALILRWGECLGLSPAQVQALGKVSERPRKAPTVVDQFQQALGLLGVRADSDPAEIKRAYRRLISQHHPDRFVGASEARIAEATERTREVRQAYALVRERLGLH